ncbi:MFS transporter [Amycolatopsis echigonensis]|uniref:AAHS family 4-hydroxybenzoate transporter-like MFS transporter n=1 Tax=Amycolatopsis echigonensis TaxID=2576905 RepID=A0A2N3WN49_9PSEU|nr:MULTISPECIES: aromatic acid/H+ symport family MFS transporter [Amycolatopsis]MBB2503830.1 aromatic acid/H+ symport family MFS transporter [Amycolatopsis echigonensis]PKV95283.1 AAHS family 4-hydroxybenzoate transporter-like MFS transporter [Amycolatopsis niigatensis]
MSASTTGRSQTLRLPGFIDERRSSWFQRGIVLLCGLVMFLDGFDTQAINYMAPAITKEWALSKADMGPIFSAALVGLMVGYLVIAPLSDKFGHKRLVVAGTLLFALSTLASVWVQNPEQLLTLRFVTGIGLGATTPSTIALTAEYSPKRLRASFVLAIYVGFSIGFVVANYAADWLIPGYGWRSVFAVGAALPLLLVVALVAWLPESLSFLIRRGRQAAAYQVFRRIDHSLPVLSDPQIEAGNFTEGKRVKLRQLVSRGQLVGTVLLWIVFALNLAMFYGLQSWVPTILAEHGYSSGTLATASSMTTIGGIAVAFAVGPAMDRLGAFGSLATLYFAGCGFLALMTVALGAPVWVLLIAIFLIGCGVSGGQKSVIALATVFYPVEVRSTGVGWALGIGRVGGILGPLIIGAALGGGWSAQQVFLALVVPSAVCGALVLYLGRSNKAAAR